MCLLPTLHTYKVKYVHCSLYKNHSVRWSDASMPSSQPQTSQLFIQHISAVEIGSASYCFSPAHDIKKALALTGMKGPLSHPQKAVLGMGLPHAERVFPPTLLLWRMPQKSVSARQPIENMKDKLYFINLQEIPLSQNTATDVSCNLSSPTAAKGCYHKGISDRLIR